jgi:sugar fermentation stimulation protein A
MRVFSVDGEDGGRRALEGLDATGGLYVLVLRVVEPGAAIRVGALGPVRFAPGCYCYVGSARQGLKARLGRHLRTGGKKVRWHVDYLRRRAEPIAVALWNGKAAGECALSRSVAALAEASVPGFGSSDCRCPSHLHYFRTDPTNLLGELEPTDPSRRRDGP